MKVIEVLKSNRQVLACCTADEPILTIAERLSSLNIGAMPVCGADSTLIGVISERDLVRGFARNGAKLTERYVRDLMTREVVTCGPEPPFLHRRRQGVAASRPMRRRRPTRSFHIIRRVGRAAVAGVRLKELR